MRQLLIAIFLLLSCSIFAQITESKAFALQKAKEEGKDILLVFAGSDWCQPCIRFDKQILQSKEFFAFADKKLVVLKCDFPQRKKLAKETIEQNEALAEQFNPNGEFPAIILLDQQLKKRSQLKYDGQTSVEFIQQLKKHFPVKIGLKEYRKKESLMGSFFEFVIVAPSDNEKEAWKSISDCIAEAKRIENLISEWIPDSEISQINQNAGKKPIAVSTELYDLLKRSQAISQLTQGAFDLTFLAYYDYWKFGKERTESFDTTKIQALSAFVDYTKISLLENQMVSIPKGFRLGLGGIGQGYAVDKIKEMLLKQGVENFVINSSGDIYAHGKQADGSPWKVGIANPVDKDKIVKWFPVENFAVVTSGTYEKNFTYKDVIYSHIINPKTGFPITGLQSVTVMSEFTEIADALATSILILGTEIGLDLVNQMPKTHCIIIDSQQNIHYSDDLEVKN